ncbi:hypothetical protein MHU86_3355 [Fragilaria crotonensis]|nr:hypothetical protein MHU86_3355 [Fragilaria crotonensis]
MTDAPWQRLVTLSSALHSTLPLRQLVPIHAALIRAVCHDGVTPTEMTAKNFTALPDAALQEQEPPLQLLTIQYLLHNITSIDRLIAILIPLLQQQHDQESPLLCNDELREALLDAVFGDLTIADATTTSLDNTLHLLQGIPHIWTCRILVRLHPICQVPNLIVHHILEGLATGSPATIRPITLWLVPLLCDATTTKTTPSPLLRVWNACLELMALVVTNDMANPESDKALMTSAVLCSVLPHVISYSSGLEDTTVHAQFAPLLEPLVWMFISNLLHRGAHVDVKGGSFQYKDTANQERMRRRGLYLLRILVESGTMQQQSVWAKYLMCFETLEMEQEQHLMDQVWDTVTEVCLEACANAGSEILSQETACPPPMTWNWIAAMLCRLFLSETPVLRKLVLFRFLNGRAGVQVVSNDNEPSVLDERRLALQRLPKKKHAIKSKQNALPAAPLSLVSTDFVLQAVIPSYDTLAASIGTNMNYEERGKIKVQDITPKFIEFLQAYVRCLDETRLQAFVAGILSPELLLRLRPKTVVYMLRAVSQAAEANAAHVRVLITEDVLSSAVGSFQQLFSSGSIVVTFRLGLLQGYATILAASTLQGALDPKVVLRVLTLYPLDLAPVDSDNRMDHATYKALQQWIATLGDSPLWGSTTAATCASAFVQSRLMIGLLHNETWDPIAAATSDAERAMGAAIVLLATLSSATAATSSLLWPAIYKGLSTTPSAELKWINAEKASRAMILLENGCRLEVVSGLGNGDLVVQRGTQQMMPPPPNIEGLLSNAVDFLLNHARALSSLRKEQAEVAAEGADVATAGSTRSGTTHRISTTFALVIAQLKVLAESYPSSMAVSSASERMLETAVKAMMLLKDEDSIDVVTCTSLSYAALSCGADPWFTWDGISTVSACEKLLRLEFIGSGDNMMKQEEQTARSVFHYARWGCLSALLPKLVENEARDDIAPLLEQVFSRALELAEATPMDALLPLFESVRTAAASWMELKGEKASYPSHLENIITVMFAAMSDMSTSSTATFMLNGICALIFRPAILLDEYQRLQVDPDYQAPVRAAFRKLMKIAGCLRSHFLKAALCHICAGWLGLTARIILDLVQFHTRMKL